MALQRSTFGFTALTAASLFLVASTASALSLNATDNGTQCAPPSSDCSIIVVKTSSQRGRRVVSDYKTIRNHTEEELLEMFGAEFIVAGDLQDDVAGASTSVRGQSIGF